MRMLPSLILLAIVVFAGATPAAGSDARYPSKPLRIVTNAVGGGADFIARQIALGIAAPLGHQVIVDNRGNTSGEIVSRAQPDGYTLLLNGGNFWLTPYLRDRVAYDPVKDFATVSLTNSAPNILVVHPSLPVKTVPELVAMAKARPGELNYSSGSAATVSHLAGELLKVMAGVNIVRVPYKGTGPAVTALLGAEVHMMFATMVSVMPHVRSGRLRGIAVTSAQRSALAPEMPTIAAGGLAGYESAQLFGMFVPARSPQTVIGRLNVEIVRLLRQPEVKERFFQSGMDTAGSSPEEFATTIKADMTRMGKVIRDAGIREE